MHKRYCLLFIVLLSCFSGFSKTLSKVVKEPESVPNLSDAAKRKFDYYFYEGLRLKENQQYDQALETFLLCLSIDSLDAGAQCETGMLYAAVGMNNEAVNCMEKALKIDPANWWYSVRLISIHSQLKNTRRAIEIAEQLQKYYPAKVEVYNMLTSLYKETDNYEKAIAAFDKMESLTGIDESISFEKFQLYMELKRPKKGIAEIDKLINKFPTEARYKVLRGDIYMQQNLPGKAFEIYQKVLAEDPSNPHVYVSLSEYYNSENEPEKAMQSIVTALKIDQLPLETKMQIMGQYVEKLVRDTTSLDETEGLFKLLVDRYPLEEQVHGYYAAFLQFRKRNSEAISEMETMININPKNDQTWLRLITLYLSDRNYGKLMDVTARAIENLPGIPLWYFYRGMTQFQLGDNKEALLTIRKGLPLVTTQQASLKSDMYSQMADIYFKLGEKQLAFGAYEDALAADPKNMMVMNNYAYYLSLEKTELKKAEKMSARTVELEPQNSTYLDTYAWILYQQGNYSLAKFYIERAMDNVKKDDEAGVIMEHYGDILWMMGNDLKALEMWQKSYDSGNKTDDLLKKITNKGWKREK